MGMQRIRVGNGNTRNHGCNVGNQCRNARNRGENIGNVLFVKAGMENRGTE